MQRSTTTTTTVTQSSSAAEWTTKKESGPLRESCPKEQTQSPNNKTTKADGTTTNNLITTNPPRTGGFYDKKTLWEQELYRYNPSPWLFVRLTSLFGFPYLMSVLGAHVWPCVVQMAESYDLETETFALPAIGIMVMIAFFTHNALYGILYHFHIEAFDKYRVDGKPWHWESDPEGWKTMLHNTMGLILFNFLGLTFPLMLIKQYVLGTSWRLDLESLPSGGEMFWQLMFCLVMEDFGFHHAHQLLHTKHFYWIHKIHHRYHAPIAVSAAYAHPLEYLFGNIAPSMIGPGMLQSKMHAWTYMIWMAFRASAAIENHSGYEFPWSMYQAIPFKAPTEYHDFHHNRNQGTYSGVLRFWDMVYGTNAHYFEWVQKGRPGTRRKTQKKMN